jgi:hypothetical protein
LVAPFSCNFQCIGLVCMPHLESLALILELPCLCDCEDYPGTL